MEKRRYADRREYLIEAVKKRRKKVRQMAIDLKGGKCTRCGYNRCLDALEFHHLDTSKKDFGVSDKGYTRSWKKIQEELEKCILVCANCHRELHRNCSFSSKGELKNRVNSGKPSPQRGRVILSEVRRSAEVAGNVQRLGDE